MHQERKRMAFIINPVSGGKDKKPIVDLLKKKISGSFDYELIYWDRPEQSEEIIRQVKTGGYDAAVAIGGDGTINQVGKAVLGTDIILGIVPLGSGNGLARHLNIPLNINKAIGILNKWKVTSIDSCEINDTVFFCTSGIGFDALIGKRFAESSTRGFYTYFKLTMSHFIRYEAQDYDLLLDGRKVSAKAFLITFANASQYGNNAFIAPLADTSDGMIDVSILKPFRAWNMPGLGRKMFNKTLHRSQFLDSYKARDITVIRKDHGPVHYDGEPAEMGRSLNITIKPASVKVLVP